MQVADSQYTKQSAAWSSNTCCQIIRICWNLGLPGSAAHKLGITGLQLNCVQIVCNTTQSKDKSISTVSICTYIYIYKSRNSMAALMLCSLSKVHKTDAMHDTQFKSSITYLCQSSVEFKTIHFFVRRKLKERIYHVYSWIGASMQCHIFNSNSILKIE
jgi:hypothetical protein